MPGESLAVKGGSNLRADRSFEAHEKFDGRPALKVLTDDKHLVAILQKLMKIISTMF